VNDAAIAGEEASHWQVENIPEWIDAVLQRHVLPPLLPEQHQ
jgi:hypothetical protein